VALGGFSTGVADLLTFAASAAGRGAGISFNRMAGLFGGSGGGVAGPQAIGRSWPVGPYSLVVWPMTRDVFMPVSQYEA
jgi:hypothetical protein